MRLEIEVERSDGSLTTVRISPLAIIGWEIDSGRKLSDLSDGLGMREIAFLVFEQERLATTTQATNVEEYLADVVDLSPVESSPNPTDGGASLEPSSS